MFSVAEVLTPEFRQWEKVVKRKGAKCSTCKCLHFEALYKTCKTCRALHWERLYSWRVSQKKQGLCWSCVEGIDKGQSTYSCEYHLEYHRKYSAARREQARKMGLCRKYPCQNRARGAYYCEQHREAHNRTRRKLYRNRQT